MIVAWSLFKIPAYLESFERFRDRAPKWLEQIQMPEPWGWVLTGAMIVVSIDLALRGLVRVSRRIRKGPAKVSVELLRKAPPLNRGEVAGFERSKADALVESGAAIYNTRRRRLHRWLRKRLED